MSSTANNQIDDLERKWQQCLEEAESKYQDRSSPMYRDNERFTWAVETINKKYSQLKKDLIESLISK